MSRHSIAWIVAFLVSNIFFFGAQTVFASECEDSGGTCVTADACISEEVAGRATCDHSGKGCGSTCMIPVTKAAPTTGATSAATAPATAGSPVTLTNPLGSGTTLYTLVQRVIQAFLGVVGAAALLVFVYAGILWMTGGTSERIQTAKDAMKYAVIGLAMIAFAYGISVFLVDALIGNVTTQSTEPQIEYATPPPVNP